MFCQHCGKKIPDISLFCPYCGKQVSYHSQNAKRDGYSFFQTAPKNKASDIAIIGLVLSIASLVMVFRSGWSFFLAVAGIVLGAKSLQSDKKSMAIASILISALSLLVLTGIGIITFLSFFFFGSFSAGLPFWTL